MVVKTRTVEIEDEGWAGQCASPCGYVTKGWPSKKIATKRVAQHANEHDTGELMQDLDSFRAEHGVSVDENGVAGFAELEGEK